MPGKTGAPHEIPYTVQEDKPPSAEEATKPLAERVHKRLDEIAPSQIVKQTAGKLLIANASGVITGTAMSGDVTISDAGVTEIGEGKVGTTELADKGVTTVKVNDKAVTLGKLAEALGLTEGYFADGAVGEAKIADGGVTSRKAKLTAGVVQASADLSLTGSYQDIVGTSKEIAVPVASTVLVAASFGFASTGGELAVQGALRIDAEEFAGTLTSSLNSVYNVRTFEPRFYAKPLSAGTHTLKLRAKIFSGGGSGFASKESHYLFLVIAQ